MDENEIVVFDDTKKDVLSVKQKKCIDLLVAGQMKQSEIAKELHISQQSITNWKRKPEFMQALKEGMSKKIAYLAPLAVKTQEELLHADSEMVRYLTAKDILDRSGFKTQEKVQMELQVPTFYGENQLED